MTINKEQLQDPREIDAPQNLWKKIFSRGGISAETLAKLRAMKSDFQAEDGTNHEITVDTAITYLLNKIDYSKSLFPDGFRYNPRIEKDRRQLRKIEYWLKKKDYLPLISYFINRSIDRWNFADRLEGSYNQMSDQEIKSFEKAREFNRMTSTSDDPGLPDELLDIKGDRFRQESQVFLLYASALSKAIET